MTYGIKGKKYILKKTHPWQVVSPTVDEDLNDVVRRGRPLLWGPRTGQRQMTPPVLPPGPSHRSSDVIVVLVVVLVVRLRPRFEPARVHLEVDVADVAYGARPPR